MVATRLFLPLCEQETGVCTCQLLHARCIQFFFRCPCMLFVKKCEANGEEPCSLYPLFLSSSFSSPRKREGGFQKQPEEKKAKGVCKRKHEVLAKPRPFFYASFFFKALTSRSSILPSVLPATMRSWFGATGKARRGGSLDDADETTKSNLQKAQGLFNQMRVAVSQDMDALNEATRLVRKQGFWYNVHLWDATCATPLSGA